MHLIDKVPLADARVTADGYLVAEARIARTGIQNYLGRELGRPDMEVVRVYRPEDQVFSQDAMASFAHRPVSNDHPDEPVSAKNWRRHAVGMTGDQVARDGGFIRVPMTLMDEATITAVRGGKRELSCGYTCDLKFEAGKTPEGEAYDAIQTNIRGNHLAIVSAGRAGSECRVGDEAEKERTMTLKTVTVDGIPVEVTDQGAVVIATLQTRLADAAKAAEKATADHAAAISAKDKDLAAKDAEIEKLKANQIDAAKLDKLVADRADIVGKAKAIVADIDVAGKTPADIRRAVVAKKLGDAAVKDKSDDYVEARFDLLAEDAKGAGGDPVRQVLRSGLTSHDAAAGDKAHQGYVGHLTDAWKGTQTKGAA